MSITNQILAVAASIAVVAMLVAIVLAITDVRRQRLADALERKQLHHRQELARYDGYKPKHFIDVESVTQRIPVGVANAAVAAIGGAK